MNLAPEQWLERLQLAAQKPSSVAVSVVVNSGREHSFPADFQGFTSKLLSLSRSCNPLPRIANRRSASPSGPIQQISLS